MNTLVAPNLPLGTTVQLLDTNQGSVQSFVRDGAAGNTSAELVSQWFVDSAVAVPTEQQNGLSLATAFATTEQLSNAISPGGLICTIRQSVTVNIAAGSYGALELNIAARVGSALSFTIFCAFAAIPATLTSVVNTTTGTQGRITISGAAFSAARQRVRSSSTLAVTYGVGALNSATDSFIKSWYSIAGNTVVNVANGTTVTVETLLVTIARVRLVPIAQTNAQLSMQINDCILPNGITMPTTQGSSVATIVGCELPAGRINANVGLRNSKLAAPVFVGLANVGTPVLAGCLLTGAAIITLTAVNWNVGNAFDGGSCVVQSGRVDFSSLCEFSNGAGLTAVNLQQISQSAWTGGAAFGFGTPYAIGWSLESGCLVVASSVANASIPSTQNLSMTGHNLAYAAAPLTYPRAACTFAITPDPAAVAVSV